MLMMLFIDDNSSLFGQDGVELTPALTHFATTDFAAILDDLVKGNIPTNTGQPFNVNWKQPTESDRVPF